ncbi:ShlB/FhaC/HecB family hemolysin secretion/activation protein [Pseudoxanthomonas indica]|uniref:Hemolysin activation/secretion protein n=1 Tax=Pseudoxanthomonas indica TaxID=428993 RepID=A0A1T5KC42_9GAMM|nr:ShlB/FhaC/HecB family hemolysin secretion/activation protein [Pseudoxanthomonas indica]GGD48388.1 hemolysin secretion/activation protein, ShlB/FhaC/HecB family [Pseudoxanthomonas indica]SKC61312.1 Hemolysin activation/secretion protein [Pseudoxanthomonas indica]
MATLSLAMAQVGPDAQELLRQQERERALREQQKQSPDVRLESPTSAFESLPAGRSPCFRIDAIRLEGEDADHFRWALESADPKRDPATGRCLGTQGINVVMKRVQNAIIARGYVTTRVLAAPQDLTGGALTLNVIPGRIRAIRFADGTAPNATLWNAVPVSSGDLLNLRDVEMALEVFKRVPTAQADIQIVPADGPEAQPGQSDLVIAWSQSRKIRANVSLDDSGSEASGKLQAGATLSVDNALQAHDLFYLNVGHDAFSGSGKGTESWAAHYDLPVGYWLIGANASAYDYHQTVAGHSQNYVYSGNSQNADVRLSRLLYRNATRKFGAYVRAWARESKTYIDDTEIEVQRRRTGGWEAGLTWKQFLGKATLDANTAFRRGTGAFDALPAPEERFDEGTSRMKVITADAQLTAPFQIGKQVLRYTGNWRAQWNRTPLVAQDRFAIGGRYTVRGYDGEVSLTGERGWLLRNDIGLPLGGGQEMYVAADYGHVGGPATAWQLGVHLAGMALGLRGGWKGGYWDCFVGAPIDKPKGFPTAYTTTGFSLGWSF